MVESVVSSSTVSKDIAMAESVVSNSPTTPKMRKIWENSHIILVDQPQNRPKIDYTPNPPTFSIPNTLEEVDLLSTENFNVENVSIDQTQSKKRKAQSTTTHKNHKKIDAIKIPALILTVDEALTNAYGNLAGGLKVATTESTIIHQLMNQIDQARNELGLKAMIDLNVVDDTTKSMQNANFEPNLPKLKKSNETSYNNNSMIENFIELEKRMEEKMTKLFNRQTHERNPQNSQNSKKSKTKRLPINFTAINPLKINPPRMDPPRMDPPRMDPPRMDPPRMEPLRMDPPRMDPLRMDPPRINSGKTNQPKPLEMKYPDRYIPKSTTQTTWAEVVHKNTQKTINKTIKLNQKQSQQMIETIDWKNKRLIMTPRIAQNSINPILCRDKINNALKKQNITNVFVTTVALSKTKNNIVFTVDENSTVDELIKHQAIWEKEFEFDSIRKDELWHEMLVHGIETSIFDRKDGMTLLRKEIEIYNNVQLVREPMWLIRSEDRVDKMHSSVKISLRSKENFDKLMKKGIIVAGKIMKVAEFLSTKPTDQCNKCMKFGHVAAICKQLFWSCHFCAGNHESRLHSCSICKAKESCPHSPPKCINCNGAHRANDKNCEHFRAISIKTRNNQSDEL